VRMTIGSKTYRCSRDCRCKVKVLAGASEQTQHQGRSRADDRGICVVSSRAEIAPRLIDVEHRLVRAREHEQTGHILCQFSCLDEPCLFALYARPAQPAESLVSLDYKAWRRGREAEGGGLLNRYTVKSRIEGSNPSVSASMMA
jgi:hypothetical protein